MEEKHTKCKIRGLNFKSPAMDILVQAAARRYSIIAEQVSGFLYASENAV